MSSGPGWPDDMRRVLAHGDVLTDHANVALPNPPAPKSYGPFPVPHATALRVMVAPTGGNVTVTLTWTMDGVSNTSSGTSTLTFTGGTAVSQLATCLGHLVTIDLLGSVNGVTADVWAVTANPLAPSAVADWIVCWADGGAGDPNQTIVADGTLHKIIFRHSRRRDLNGTFTFANGADEVLVNRAGLYYTVAILNGLSGQNNEFGVFVPATDFTTEADPPTLGFSVLTDKRYGETDQHDPATFGAARSHSAKLQIGPLNEVLSSYRSIYIIRLSDGA